MSNAWIVACWPFARLRVSSLVLLTRPAAATILAAGRSASISCLVSSCPRIGTTTLRAHIPRPHILCQLGCRGFSTSGALSRSRSASRKHGPSDKTHASQDMGGEEAVPLPGGDLPQDRITDLLGLGITAAQGNGILRTLHHRRVTGSLAEKGVHFDGKVAFSQERALNALEYLRSMHPVDEEEAAVRWAQEEAQRLESVFVRRAQGLKLYQKGEPGHTHGNVYGHSELEALRRRNEEIYLREEAERKNNNGESGTLGPVKAKAELRKRAKSEWVKYYEDQAMLVKEKEAPYMSATARLLPSALVASIVLAGLYVLVQTYTPPPSSVRLWPDTPPALATCFALLNINLFVFLAWRFPPLWRPFNKYMLQTPGYPSALSVLGNVFSHQDPKHLFMNMLILMGAGPQLHELVGRASFLAIYLSGGVVGSLSSLVVSVAARNFAVSTLGASGALAATIGALLLLKDADRFTVPFFPDYSIPVSSYGLLTACLAYEVWGLTRRSQTGMDHVAHIAGYATGMAAGGVIKWRLAERKMRADEKKREMGFLQRTFGTGRDE